MNQLLKKINISSIDNTLNKISKFIIKTPLQLNSRLSDIYGANIYLKREDLQNVRSFKIRGALNKILNLTESEKKNGIVCASAGNHAQGVALSCNKLNINCDIFIPENTPLQKINRIKYFGNGNCNLHLIGNTFDNTLCYSLNFKDKYKKSFIHPYNDIHTIIGQGTIANEIYSEINPDIIINTIGGGGLISGVSLYSKEKNKNTLIYGVEPLTCPSMKVSIDNNIIKSLHILDNFVDGATVSTVGEIPFEICRHTVDNIFISSIGEICGKMLDLYQNDGIVLEPAGALPLTVLDNLNKNDIKGKNIVCILSGGNNDIARYNEITERYLRYQGLKYYYIIRFAQKSGELKTFINNILGPNDDITRFEYIKKTNTNYGNVLIGIQTNNKNNINKLNDNLDKHNFQYIKINENDLLYNYLI